MMISVIIVNYNGRHFLDACLSSLINQTFQDIEIILVDNASTDGTAGYIRRNYSSVIIIENAENRGFAGGINDGIRVARGKYILTMNNDTTADPQFVEHLKNAMDKEDTIGMCAAKMLFPDGRINSAGMCISRSGAAWDRGMFSLDAGQFNIPEEVFGPCAGAALYRKKLLDEIGLFDEDFFLFMEDVDLAFRARLAGWRCMYVPQARVIHIHGGTAGYKSDISIYYGNRNLLWYVVKNFPLAMLIEYLPWIIGRNIGVIPYHILNGKGRVIINAKTDALLNIRTVIKKREPRRKKGSNHNIKRWMHAWCGIRSL